MGPAAGSFGSVWESTRRERPHGPVLRRYEKREAGCARAQRVRFWGVGGYWIL